MLCWLKNIFIISGIINFKTYFKIIVLLDLNLLVFVIVSMSPFDLHLLMNKNNLKPQIYGLYYNLFRQKEQTNDIVSICMCVCVC